MLQSMGSQRVKHSLVTEHQQDRKLPKPVAGMWVVCFSADELAPECGFSAHLGGWLVRWSFQCPEWLSLIFRTPWVAEEVETS